MEPTLCSSHHQDEKELVIGIDPGNSGAVVFITLDGRNVFFEKLKDKTEKDVFDIIHSFAHSAAFCVIEGVHSMPKDSAKAAWAFSASYHGLRMALVACKVPFDKVSPQKWKKHFDCIIKDKEATKTQKKNITKAKAQALFPHVKITHANADALLIAEYTRRNFTHSIKE